MDTIREQIEVLMQKIGHLEDKLEQAEAEGDEYTADTQLQIDELWEDIHDLEGQLPEGDFPEED